MPGIDLSLPMSCMSKHRQAIHAQLRGQPANHRTGRQSSGPHASSKSRNRRSGAHLRNTRHLLDGAVMNGIPVFPAVRSALHPSPHGPSEASISFCRATAARATGQSDLAALRFSDEAVATVSERAMWVRPGVPGMIPRSPTDKLGHAGVHVPRYCPCGPEPTAGC